jgi:hypothetical protein
MELLGLSQQIDIQVTDQLFYANHNPDFLSAPFII